jgi:hypothetical protein
VAVQLFSAPRDFDKDLLIVRTLWQYRDPAFA